MPAAAYGEAHPDFMRVNHVQLTEGSRALKREKAAAPNGGRRNRNEHYQLAPWFCLPDRQGRGRSVR